MRLVCNICNACTTDTKAPLPLPLLGACLYLEEPYLPILKLTNIRSTEVNTKYGGLLKPLPEVRGERRMKSRMGTFDLTKSTFLLSLPYP